MRKERQKTARVKTPDAADGKLYFVNHLNIITQETAHFTINTKSIVTAVQSAPIEVKQQILSHENFVSTEVANRYTIKVASVMSASYRVVSRSTINLLSW